VSEPRDPGAGSPADLAAALGALTAVARRLDAASRLEPPGGEAVLRSIVEATVAMFGSEAASLALHDPSTDRLVFRVAAGARGEGVIGLSIEPGEGVAGYVFATGSPLVIGDVAADPRFGRDAAERTGYVPRSLLAVPLVADADVIGVLEILDRLDGTTFGLRDIELATVFARQASVAIQATRLERHGAHLLRDALISVATAAPGALDDAGIEALVGAAFTGEATEDAPVWRIADRLARLRAIDADDAGLVVDILDAVLRRNARRGPHRPSRS
jgi:signal transduction protein with GAF and PtsI domain